MKNSILILGSILLGSIALTGCYTSSEEKVDAEKEVVEANKALEDARKAYLEEVNAYKTENEKLIQKNQERIEELKILIEMQKKEVKSINLKSIEELERQNNNLKNKLYDYKESDATNWNGFKSEFMKELKELNSNIEEFPN